MTDPLAFTVCKLELRGKAIVLKSLTFQNDAKLKQTKEQVPQRGFKEAHVAVVNKGQNERKKKTYFHKTRTNRGLVSDNKESDNEE